MALSGSVFEIWHVTDRQTDRQTDRHPHRFMIWPHVVGHIIIASSVQQLERKQPVPNREHIVQKLPPVGDQKQSKRLVYSVFGRQLVEVKRQRTHLVHLNTCAPSTDLQPINQWRLRYHVISLKYSSLGQGRQTYNEIDPYLKTCIRFVI